MHCLWYAFSICSGVALCGILRILYGFLDLLYLLYLVGCLMIIGGLVFFLLLLLLGLSGSCRLLRMIRL